MTKCEIVLKAPRLCLYCEIEECTTLGDHIRKTRIEVNEPQGCVGQMLSVKTDTITNWELNRNTPQVKYVPKIIKYLGYTSLFHLPGNSLSQSLKQFMYMDYHKKNV